jgi:hypothetical protein
VSLFIPEAASDEGDVDARVERENEILRRASEGDLGTLHAAGPQPRLYGRVLETLIDAYERQGSIATLVGYITKSDGLRGSARLAERVIAAWQPAPDRRSTVEMVHVAAISDDSATYSRALTLAIEAFKAGRMAGFSAEDLLALAESQYWVLASEARCGGAGYGLRQQLAQARRDLAATAPLK